jgi:hypothetical protein
MLLMRPLAIRRGGVDHSVGAPTLLPTEFRERIQVLSIRARARRQARCRDASAPESTVAVWPQEGPLIASNRNKDQLFRFAFHQSPG